MEKIRKITGRMIITAKQPRQLRALAPGSKNLPVAPFVVTTSTGLPRGQPQPGQVGALSDTFTKQSGQLINIYFSLFRSSIA
jgi:hypothetical protein